MASKKKTDDRLEPAASLATLVAEVRRVYRRF